MAPAEIVARWLGLDFDEAVLIRDASNELVQLRPRRWSRAWPSPRAPVVPPSAELAPRAMLALLLVRRSLEPADLDLIASGLVETERRLADVLLPPIHGDSPLGNALNAPRGLRWISAGPLALYRRGEDDIQLLGEAKGRSGD